MPGNGISCLFLAKEWRSVHSTWSIKSISDARGRGNRSYFLLPDDISQGVDDRLLAGASTCESEVAVGADQDERGASDAEGGVSLPIGIDQGLVGDLGRVIRGREGVRP